MQQAEVVVEARHAHILRRQAFTIQGLSFPIIRQRLRQRTARPTGRGRIDQRGSVIHAAHTHALHQRQTLSAEEHGAIVHAYAPVKADQLVDDGQHRAAIAFRQRLLQAAQQERFHLIRFALGEHGVQPFQKRLYIHRRAASPFIFCTGDILPRPSG